MLGCQVRKKGALKSGLLPRDGLLHLKKFYLLFVICYQTKWVGQGQTRTRLRFLAVVIKQRCFASYFFGGEVGGGCEVEEVIFCSHLQKAPTA